MHVTDLLNPTITTELDLQGRPVKVTNALGKTTQIEYDRGDVASVTDTLSSVTSFTADALGRVVVVTDPIGERTRTEYEVLDRVVHPTDARGGSRRRNKGLYKEFFFLQEKEPKRTRAGCACRRSRHLLCPLLLSLDNPKEVEPQRSSKKERLGRGEGISRFPAVSLDFRVK